MVGPKAVYLALLACMFSLASVSDALALELNQANRAQIEQLRGVGVAGADRILVERDKREFSDWSDLMTRVKGVKHGMATRFSKAGVTVNGAAFGSSSTAPVSPTSSSPRPAGP
jgi:competence protein ComEA